MRQELAIELAREAGFGNYAYEAAGIFVRFADLVEARAMGTPLSGVESEALRLAAVIDGWTTEFSIGACEDAAAELRRLHAENLALRSCAVKYLRWLNVQEPESALARDLVNPEMVNE